jgi:hypothetical protein
MPTHINPEETLYREKNPSKQYSFIALINVRSLTNIHHDYSALKELAKLTLT